MDRTGQRRKRENYRGLEGGKGCVTGWRALKTVESRRPDPLPGAILERDTPPHSPAGSFRPGCEREPAPRPGAAPARGGRRAERGRLGSRRLCWAGAGRVGPPGAAGRAAFLMCHQHVEADRAQRASERNTATFEGPRSSAHVLHGGAGTLRRSSGPGAGLERPGTLGRECTKVREHRGTRPQLRPRCGRKQPGSPRLGPASPG